MEVAIRDFAVGQCVFAKIKGYPSWPGLITQLDKKKAKVVYFNWHNQFNWIGFKKLTPIASAAKIHEQNYDRNARFKRAVDEMNLILGSLAKERMQKSSKQPALKEKNPLYPVVYLKKLTKDEIASIIDGLKKQNKKNKWNLRERKQK